MPRSSDAGEDLLRRFRAGDTRALSRVISLAERESADFPSIYDRLWSELGGRPARTGITGPPGAGKSTLVSALIAAARREDRRVGVVAVDPTSPFTGGALLGDRVRMTEHTLDSGVFIRSMATRGSLGGLARRSIEVVDLMDAFGFDEIFVETVGVGQIEHDVVEATDVAVVVLHPGTGDSVQALKAGMLELADVLVVNKADQYGADRVVADLQEMLQLRLHRHGDVIPICKTVATAGDGIAELRSAIDDRLHRRSEAPEQRREERRRAQIRRIVEAEIARRLWGTGESALEPPDGPPYEAAAALAARILEREKR